MAENKWDFLLNRFAPDWPKAIDVGDGWYDLLKILDQDLAAYDPDYQIHQVKQKWGALRFYTVHQCSDKCGVGSLCLFTAMVSAAEIVSAKVCEECGAHGEKCIDHGWIVVLCDACKNPFVQDYDSNKSLWQNMLGVTQKKFTCRREYGDESP